MYIDYLLSSLLLFGTDTNNYVVRMCAPEAYVGCWSGYRDVSDGNGGSHCEISVSVCYCNTTLCNADSRVLPATWSNLAAAIAVMFLVKLSAWVDETIKIEGYYNFVQPTPSNVLFNYYDSSSHERLTTCFDICRLVSRLRCANLSNIITDMNHMLSFQKPWAALCNGSMHGTPLCWQKSSFDRHHYRTTKID